MDLLSHQSRWRYEIDALHQSIDSIVSMDAYLYFGLKETVFFKDTARQVKTLNRQVFNRNSDKKM